MRLEHLYTRDTARRLIQEWKAGGKTVVAVSGSFDLLHVGHRSLLDKVHKEGDVLIVLLNSDASVQAYKGPGRPVVGEHERAEAIEALGLADAIVLFDELTPVSVLKDLQPDVYVTSEEYGKRPVERSTVEAYGGKVKLIPRTPEVSSSKEIAIATTLPEPARAVMFDRDGTLIDDVPYLRGPKGVRWLPGAFDTLRALRDAGFLLFVVTNQSGIGRGLLSEGELMEVHSKLKDDLRSEGIELDGIYYCPHAPGDNCSCRKPEVGMLLDAVRDHGIALSKSWMIGNSCTDVMAGKYSNMRTVLVGSEERCECDPTFICPDLGSVAKHILEYSL